MEAFGRDYGTLKNYKSVAGKFELSRRRDNLDHKHHIEVASLDPVLADELLDRAEAELVTGNAQGELAALEIGLHALKAALKLGKAKGNVSRYRDGTEVLSIKTVVSLQQFFTAS